MTNHHAHIFDIQDLSVQDGPGIRTTVFMKGCPLECRWCSNPEGQKLHPELMHISGLCNRTYKCVSVCPYGAVQKTDGSYPQFDRDKCKDCESRECTDACPSRALKFVGRNISVEDLIKRIKPNLSFYKNSLGGVTFSGGEPFLQTDFIKEFINRTSSFGLSVGVETCGMYDGDEVSEIADKIEFFYFDIKCMDGNLHKEVTGSSNEKILENLKSLAENYSKNVIVSIPIIPGMNDTEINIKSIADFSRENGIRYIRLIAYHSLGESKYYYLGREYLMDKNLAVSQNHLNNLKSIVESLGIYCNIE